MDNKEKVLTLASAARKVGVDPDELKNLIFEGGNLLIGEDSLKGIMKEIETTELTQDSGEIILHDDIKLLLSQAANFIERQEEELRVYREREEKHISLLKGAEKQINKSLDQLNILYSHNIKLGNENREILKKLIDIQSKNAN